MSNAIKLFLSIGLAAALPACAGQVASVKDAPPSASPSASPKAEGGEGGEGEKSAWKTADLAFGRHQKNSKLNFLPFEDYNEAQVAEMKANVTPLLTVVPASSKNTVIVGHDDIFEAATGIYPDPQGMAYILKPDGNGSFKIVASMLPDEWAKL